jgi:ubiquinone/menaquinone biosynthesis C-methylase UbiE
MSGLMRCMSRLVEGRTEIQLLDLGCGSGLFAIPFAKNLGYQTVGADCSAEMLKYGATRANGDLVRWDQQDATSMTYENETFDIVFISNLLDLITSPADVVSECHRVLKPGGVIIHHYAALEDILKDPEHKFFPETVELDYLRTPARKQVETWFREALLKDINSERNTYRLWKNAQERLATVEGKASSGLRLISFDAFNIGLSKLRSYAASNPMDPWLRDSTVTTTYGRK